MERTLRYVKKPIPIEAIQWDGNNFEEIQEFMREHNVIKTSHNELIIPTLEGEMKAPIESWIIRGPMG